MRLWTTQQGPPSSSQRRDGGDLRGHAENTGLLRGCLFHGEGERGAGRSEMEVTAVGVGLRDSLHVLAHLACLQSTHRPRPHTFPLPPEARHPAVNPIPPRVHTGTWRRWLPVVPGSCMA